MTVNTKWVGWVLLALFLFLTLSGSRRSYYILPLLPFAILLTADWIHSWHVMRVEGNNRIKSMALITFFAIFIYLVILTPWYYSQFGIQHFTKAFESEINKNKSLKNYEIVLLDTQSKIKFYLKLPPTVKSFSLTSDKRKNLNTTASMLAVWPVLTEKGNDKIFITRKLYAPMLKPILTEHRMFEVNYPIMSYLNKTNMTIPVAFIPKKVLTN
jgi:hypothetical protein